MKGINRKVPGQVKLQHYHYRVLSKRSGLLCLIESPWQQIKGMQRQTLHEILSRMRATPPFTALLRNAPSQTFAAPHTGRRLVLRMDLQDFFPSIRRARIQTIFHMLGYPERVADFLGGVCTNAAFRSIFRKLDANLRAGLQAFYGPSHLPQGAPSSPALANLCCHRLIPASPVSPVPQQATYTRY